MASKAKRWVAMGLVGAGALGVLACRDADRTVPEPQVSMNATQDEGMNPPGSEVPMPSEQTVENPSTDPTQAPTWSGEEGDVLERPVEEGVGGAGMAGKAAQADGGMKMDAGMGGAGFDDQGMPYHDSAEPQPPQQP